MKNISEITPETIKNMITNRLNGEKAYSESDFKVINDTFKRLQGMRTGWRAGFKNQTEIDNYKTELLKACVSHRINNEAMMEKGLFEASKETGNGSEFLPSVNKFINWCKPKQHWEHVSQKKAAQVPVGRWLTDEGSKARIQAAKEKAMKIMRGEK